MEDLLVLCLACQTACFSCSRWNSILKMLDTSAPQHNGNPGIFQLNQEVGV